jgi:hypothetical protein
VPSTGDDAVHAMPSRWTVAGKASRRRRWMARVAGSLASRRRRLWLAHAIRAAPTPRRENRVHERVHEHVQRVRQTPCARRKVDGAEGRQGPPMRIRCGVWQ